MGADSMDGGGPLYTGGGTTVKVTVYRYSYYPDGYFKLLVPIRMIIGVLHISFDLASCKTSNKTHIFMNTQNTIIIK